MVGSAARTQHGDGEGSSYRFGGSGTGAGSQGPQGRFQDPNGNLGMVLSVFCPLVC